MELDCGGIKGGWMKIADLNTKSENACPGGWTSYKSYCTGGQAAGCYSTNFTTVSTSYSKICGKVLGYQQKTMDGFYPSAYAYGRVNGYIPKTSSRSLDGVYVDGVSVTCGNPCKHVWTYAATGHDAKKYQIYNCPCAEYPGPDPPIFVGSHYYCKSGPTGTLLWDGVGCRPENNCCYDAGMPWFFRQFPTTTTGDIEVRICHDQAFADEGVAVEELQLYVQ